MKVSQVQFWFDLLLVKKWCGSYLMLILEGREIDTLHSDDGDAASSSEVINPIINIWSKSRMQIWIFDDMGKWCYPRLKILVYRRIHPPADTRPKLTLWNLPRVSPTAANNNLSCFLALPVLLLPCCLSLPQAKLHPSLFFHSSFCQETQHQTFDDITKTSNFGQIISGLIHSGHHLWNSTDIQI